MDEEDGALVVELDDVDVAVVGGEVGAGRLEVVELDDVDVTVDGDEVGSEVLEVVGARVVPVDPVVVEAVGSGVEEVGVEGGSAVVVVVVVDVDSTGFDVDVVGNVVDVVVVVAFTWNTCDSAGAPGPAELRARTVTCADVPAAIVGRRSRRSFPGVSTASPSPTTWTR